MTEDILFSDACNYVKEYIESFSDEQKIKFYALYKQSKVGDCNTERPGGLFNWERKKMWDEWEALKEKNIKDPQQMYVDYLSGIRSDWRCS